MLTIFPKTLALLCLLGMVLSTSVDPLVCVHMTPENNPILSKAMYKDLIKVLDWDIGQRELMDELTKENNYLMQCLLVNGFHYGNIIECTGEKYLKVIQVYTAEFFKIKSNFQSAISGVVASKGYDEHDYLPVLNQFKKDLMDNLNNNEDPDIALSKFERAVTSTDNDDEDFHSDHGDDHGEHIVEDSHDEHRERRLGGTSHAVVHEIDEPDFEEEEEDFESSPEFKQMYEQLQNNYLIYVSLKKIVKGYILTTIRCVQEFAEKSEVMIPADENIRLFNKTLLEETFPESEMIRVFEERKELESEMKEIVNNNSKSFNSDMAKQGKYNHLVALHIANGNIGLNDVDLTQSPEKIFKDSLLPKMGKNYLDRGDDPLL